MDGVQKTKEEKINNITIMYISSIKCANKLSKRKRKEGIETKITHVQEVSHKYQVSHYHY